jgi:hypothetical protein
MKLTTKESTRTDVFVEIAGKEFNAVTVKEVLEGLADTDPYFVRIAIDDYGLEKALRAENVIWKSVRGSVCKGERYKGFIAEFEAATGWTVELE